MLPLYINADNSVSFNGLESAGVFINNATLTFTVYRHMAGDGAMTLGSATLNASEATFVAGDVGRSIVVRGAGVNGADLRTTIATYVSATQVTLATTASSTVTGAYVRMSLPNAVSVSMPNVAASDGDYEGVCDDSVPLRRKTKYWVEIAIDAGSGKKDFRVLEAIAEYREEV